MVFYPAVINYTCLCYFDDAQLEIIPGSHKFNNIGSSIESYNKKITDEGVKHLSKLTSLNLDSNKEITDEGIKHLSNLTCLVLWCNYKITDEGMTYLSNLTEIMR
mgnify:CR=1 FL=1